MPGGAVSMLVSSLWRVWGPCVFFFSFVFFLFPSLLLVNHHSDRFGLLSSLIPLDGLCSHVHY